MFRAFWGAGFEAASHVTRSGVRLDMVAATQHDRFVDEDYAALDAFGLRTVREGVRWPLVERGGRLDFASLRPFVEASARRGIEVIWTLCHYGWPDDLDVLSPRFPERFARYCGAVAAFLQDTLGRPQWYTPINEPSFLCWATGSAAFIHPCLGSCDAELKRQFVRASLAAADAIRGADQHARFVYVDPVINVIAPPDRPDLLEEAEHYTASQFEAWDMLLGRREPELGGSLREMDCVGVNFYHRNQWEHQRTMLHWHVEPRDARWLPLHRLVERVYERYRLPVWIGETSHFGEGRARWLREVADEACTLLRKGVPLQGVCLYPIIDRPDWDDPDHWHNSGLWDVARRPDGTLARVLNEEYAEALRDAQARVAATQVSGLQALVSGR